MWILSNLLNIKFYSALFSFACLVSFIIFFQFYLYNALPAKEVAVVNTDHHILIWWTPFLEKERVKKCGDSLCVITADRRLKTHPNHQAFLFYGSSFNKTDLPLPRRKKLWALFHEESPRNVALLSHEPVLSLFNYSATFSHHSNVPLTLQHLPTIDAITTTAYFKTVEQKNEYQKFIAPIIYIQSDCSTPNNRDSYVKELMEYISVDSYGACLHNKALPASLKDALKTMMAPDLMEFVSHYKFALAFENAVCEDYITEKLWRPIIAGSLPIYAGSPSVRDWLPNNNTAVLVSDFKSPKDLAEYLINLNNNEIEYNKFFEHKTEQKITNWNLVKNFRVFWPENPGAESIIDDFECFVCKKTYEKEASVINKDHYNCPEPVSLVDLSVNKSNWWHRDYMSSKCEAKLLKKFVQAYEGDDYDYSFSFDTESARHAKCPFD